MLITFFISDPEVNSINATIPRNCDQDDGLQVLSLSSYEYVVMNGQDQTTNQLNQNVCIGNND
jgi:hypothetical protein